MAEAFTLSEMSRNQSVGARLCNEILRGHFGVGVAETLSMSRLQFGAYMPSQRIFARYPVPGTSCSLMFGAEDTAWPMDALYMQTGSAVLVSHVEISVFDMADHPGSVD